MKTPGTSFALCVFFFFVLTFTPPPVAVCRPLPAGHRDVRGARVLTHGVRLPAKPRLSRRPGWGPRRGHRCPPARAPCWFAGARCLSPRGPWCHRVRHGAVELRRLRRKDRGLGGGPSARAGRSATHHGARPAAGLAEQPVDADHAVGPRGGADVDHGVSGGHRVEPGGPEPFGRGGARPAPAPATRGFAR